MNRLSHYWEQLWFLRPDPLPLSFFRINVGFLMLLSLLFSFPNWERFYGLNGVISQDVSLIRQTGEPQDPWNCFYWTDGILPIHFWWFVGVAAAICFTIGLQTRCATVILYLLQSSFIHRTRMMTNGDDLVFRMVLLYAMFAPLGARLSVDRWLSDRREDNPPEHWPWIWAQRMIQIQIVLIYAISLPFKFAQDDAWAQGQAIYWTMVSDMWYRGFFPELAYKWGPGFSYLATYGTVLIEGTFPLFVWFQRPRMWSVWALTALHLGIAVVIPNVAFFTLSMVASFWVFYPPEMLERLLNRVKRLGTPSQSPKESAV